MEKSSRFARFSLVAVVVCLSVAVFAGATKQKPNKVDLEKRVEKLEARIAILERILFSTTKLDTQRAERQLEAAKSRLKSSKTLYAKGFITELQLQLDEMQVQEAQQELEIAKSDAVTRRSISELDLLSAERELKIAEEQLTARSQLARRGYVTMDEVEQARKAVDTATLKLEHARNKLKAATELDALKK